MKFLKEFWEPEILGEYSAKSVESENVIANRPDDLDEKLSKTLLAIAEGRVARQTAGIQQMIGRCYDLARVQVTLVVGYVGILKIVENRTQEAETILGVWTIAGAIAITAGAAALFPCLKSHPLYLGRTLAELGDNANFLSNSSHKETPETHLAFITAIRMHPVLEANECVARWIAQHLGVSVALTVVGMVSFILDIIF